MLCCFFFSLTCRTMRPHPPPTPLFTDGFLLVCRACRVLAQWTATCRRGASSVLSFYLSALAEGKGLPREDSRPLSHGEAQWAAGAMRGAANTETRGSASHTQRRASVSRHGSSVHGPKGRGAPLCAQAKGIRSVGWAGGGPTSELHD